MNQRRSTNGREAIAKLTGASLAEDPHQMSFQTGDIWEAGDIGVDRVRRPTPQATYGLVAVRYRRTGNSGRPRIERCRPQGWITHPNAMMNGPPISM